MKQPVVENEIRKIIFSVYDDAFLTRLETEAFPKFQQELLQVSEQGFFNIAFRNDIFGLETEKLKRLGVAYLQKRGVSLCLAVCKHHRFHLILRQSDANVKVGNNLTA